MKDSVDNYINFMIENKFTETESSEFLRIIGDHKVYCDYFTDPYTARICFEIVCKDDDFKIKSNAVFKKRYEEYDDFESDLKILLREERFKILLNKR